MKNLERMHLFLPPEIIFSDGCSKSSISKEHRVTEKFENNKYYLTVYTDAKLFDFEENWKRYSRHPILVFWYIQDILSGADYSRPTIYKNWRLISFESCADSEDRKENKYVFECDIREEDKGFKNC